MSTNAGTTKTGFVNGNGQVTIRNTQRPGNDHMQYTYQVVCSHCGYNYGSNGSDLYDSRSAISSGVPSNTDIVILSNTASLGSGFNSGIRWNKQVIGGGQCARVVACCLPLTCRPQRPYD
jgi:hypothetical protein